MKFTSSLPVVCATCDVARAINWGGNSGQHFGDSLHVEQFLHLLLEIFVIHDGLQLIQDSLPI
jgi:hypothetical protein